VKLARFPGRLIRTFGVLAVRWQIPADFLPELLGLNLAIELSGPAARAAEPRKRNRHTISVPVSSSPPLEGESWIH
jgi:hypothetical protein